MGAENSIGQLLREVKSARSAIETRDQQTMLRVDELERSINEILLGQRRPGSSESYGDDRDIRQSAIEMCQARHSWEIQKVETREVDYAPSGAEIESAIIAQKAWHKIIRHGHLERLDHVEQKSLSAFSFGGAGWVTPPEISSRILSCLVDQTDFMSMLGQETISGSSILFPLDNSELTGANWACETECVGPIATIPPPGMIEIKPESLRAVVCTTRDLVEDASFNLEGWIRAKAERAFRQKLADAFIAGDGNGRPLGVLNPLAGVPVCDVSPATPPGTFTWADLILLKHQMPEQFAARATYLMNSRTFAMVLTMSDAIGRPLWMQFPSGDGSVAGQFQIGGSPVRIVSQMPDISPGSTPILVADLSALYLVIIRRGIGMIVDPYSAGGWCIVHRFDARIGGSVVCPAAGRLLRIN
jgi:HK97 family phage major capsid protein